MLEFEVTYAGRAALEQKPGAALPAHATGLQRLLLAVDEHRSLYEVSHHVRSEELVPGLRQLFQTGYIRVSKGDALLLMSGGYTQVESKLLFPDAASGWFEEFKQELADKLHAWLVRSAVNAVRTIAFARSPMELRRLLRVAETHTTCVVPVGQARTFFRMAGRDLMAAFREAVRREQFGLKRPEKEMAQTVAPPSNSWTLV